MADDYERIIGKRVTAVLSVDDKAKIINLIGRGVFAGLFVPVDALGPIAEKLRETEETNPRIDLDDGNHVWGCECWWMGEKQADLWMMDLVGHGYKIKNITVEEMKNQYKALKGETK
jgi:hypothetical protein